jgi:hypothetical protein
VQVLTQDGKGVEMTEVERLRAAVATIHNHLHAGNVNAAHEACECAMVGEEVSQPNLTLSQTATAQLFAHRFVELCKSLDVKAAFIALMPSATVPGATSFQVGGEVDACKLIENAMGRSSIYQGEHGR